MLCKLSYALRTAGRSLATSQDTGSHTQRLHDTSTLSIAGFVFLWILVLVGCSPAPTHGPSVGIILDYTGEEASGFDEEQALLLAARLIEDARAGEPRFRFVYRDTHDNPAEARRAAADLVAEGVDVVIGPSTDRLASVVAEVLQEASVALVSPNATIGATGTEEAPWFRMSPGNLTGSTTPELLGEHMARELTKRGARRALLLHDDDVYNVELSSGFESALASRGGELVKRLSGPSAHTDAVIAALSDVDAVVVALSISAASRLITDVYSRTRTPQTWLLTPRLKSELLTVNTPPGALERAFGVSLRIPTRVSGCDHLPGQQCFIRAMQETLGRAPFENTYFMYDASAVVLIALDKVWRENAGSIERTDLARAIFASTDRGGVQIGWNDFPLAIDAARTGGKVQYVGATGAIVFTPSGVRVGGDTVAFEVANHAFVDVTN